MPTQDTNVTEAPEANEAAPPATESESEGKGLRKQLEAALSENRELKAEKRDDLIGGLGLNPTEGMGLVLAEQFDKGDVTLDNLVEVATTKYGVAPPQPSVEHPQAGDIRQAQQRVETLGQQAGSIPLETDVADIAKAEAEGDHQTSLLLKSGQVADQMGLKR